MLEKQNENSKVYDKFYQIYTQFTQDMSILKDHQLRKEIAAIIENLDKNSNEELNYAIEKIEDNQSDFTENRHQLVLEFVEKMKETIVTSIAGAGGMSDEMQKTFDLMDKAIDMPCQIRDLSEISQDQKNNINLTQR